jgi:hypothetical protein
MQDSGSDSVESYEDGFEKEDEQDEKRIEKLKQSMLK